MTSIFIGGNNRINRFKNVCVIPSQKIEQIQIRVESVCYLLTERCCYWSSLVSGLDKLSVAMARDTVGHFARRFRISSIP